ncbi:hypothetical protein [Phenylobacterium aquaticum]|uniref:hypothetical protein n=1 Tax=Phenylobacterium aquaticum TaxID=1763816 RepID=UPI0026E9717E|nr:hypothetical protein [Phenylobacterium aquaticum]
MFSRTLIASAGLAALLAVAATAPAEAAGHSRSTSVQGSGGHGYTSSAAVSRVPGATASSRSVQTNAGYGGTSSRTATYGNGAYQGSGGVTLNNGMSTSHDASVQANGDGSAAYSASRTGVTGQSTSVSGTVSHTGPQ